jgi:tRNA (cmo5U34)-methyltransferase
MLEKMDDFFTARVDGYDEHMKSNIEGASKFYNFTASLLPMEKDKSILDLGCGTGLELEELFQMNPYAKVTGIDMTEAMLETLKEKFPNKDITTVCGSYFDINFGEEVFDAAVSVESLHHFTKEDKIPLYKKLNKALKSGGYFVLTDYFAESEEEEIFYGQELIRIRKEQELPDGVFYHYDTPLTVEHEKEALLEAGFTRIEVLNRWESTSTLRAIK